MPKHIFIPECETLLWFPDNPRFNQWLTKPSLNSYGIGRLSEYATEGDTVSHVLINWSSVVNVYAFQIKHSSVKPMEFYSSDTFKLLKSQMDGITMKGGFLMIEQPSDVVIFRMIYGERI